MSAAAVQTPTAEPASWDLKPPLKDYSSTVQAPPTVIPKTLDYAHGHGMSSKEKKNDFTR